MSVNAQLKTCQDYMAKLLPRYLPPDTTRLTKAMHYACLNGGKRLRPLLVYSVADLFHVPMTTLDPLASAVEFIHCYSLIHDDLPAMDNDTLRRGKPTCHIVFGEANTILAGNALLTLAFQLITDEDFPLNDNLKLRIISLLSKAVGFEGLMHGQYLDLCEDKNLSLALLEETHFAKTGALITASLTTAALATALADEKALLALTQYGKAIGMAFQIQDDILDVTGDSHQLGKNTGQDAKNEKMTFVTFFGVEGAIKKAKEYHETAMQALTYFPNSQFLQQLADFMIQRVV